MFCSEQNNKDIKTIPDVLKWHIYEDSLWRRKCPTRKTLTPTHKIEIKIAKYKEIKMY